MILTVSMALTLGVVLGGPLFIELFFKPKWHPAGMLAQFASIGAWVMLLQVSADRALLALGKTRVLATSNAVNLVVTIGGGLLGRYLDLRFNHQPGNIGIVGFIVGMSAGKIAGHLMIQIEMARNGISIFRQDTLYSAMLLVMCLAGIALPRLLPAFDVHQFLYEGVAAITVCVFVCAWAGLKVLRGIR